MTETPYIKMKEQQIRICTLSIPDDLGKDYLKDLHSGQGGDYEDYPALGVSIITLKTHIWETLIKFVIIRVNTKEFMERNRPWLFQNSQGLVILFQRFNPDDIEKARGLYLQFQKMNPDDSTTTVFIDVIPESKRSEKLTFPEPEGNESGVFFYEILEANSILKAFERIAKEKLMVGSKNQVVG
ncbi:MAG: hypothetical protein ACFFE8_06855 [Candidatus Heimdallarchaeota archaeon]